MGLGAGLSHARSRKGLRGGAMAEFAYLSVVIPTFGTKGVPLTETCLASLRKQHEHLGVESIEVIIVEDSQDESVLADLYTISQKYNARLFSQPNGGFSKACNLGLKKCNGIICFLVNNDIEFIEPSLQLLADAMN